MAANAIIVHGCPDREEYYDPAAPSASNHHWLPWLANQANIPTRAGRDTCGLLRVRSKSAFVARIA
jgi:hypothetical protein